MPHMLILLTDAQLHALRLIKQDTGVPMREFVRRAVEAALARREAEHPTRATEGVPYVP